MMRRYFAKKIPTAVATIRTEKQSWRREGDFGPGDRCSKVVRLVR